MEHLGIEKKCISWSPKIVEDVFAQRPIFLRFYSKILSTDLGHHHQGQGGEQEERAGEHAQSHIALCQNQNLKLIIFVSESD